MILENRFLGTIVHAPLGLGTIIGDASEEDAKLMSKILAQS